MTVELGSIAALAVMLLGLTFFQGGLVPRTQGLRWGLGGRDAPVELSPLQGRSARAVQNHIEAMLMYIPLMALVILMDRTSNMTAIAAWMVTIGRLAFIPLYLLGTFAVRSVAYAVATLGILVTAWELLV